MHLEAQQEFAHQSNRITITLLLPRGVRERWLLHLMNRKWRKSVHLRILMERHTLAAIGSKELLHTRARARYQPVGADYVRQNVKLHWHHWASLQALARGLGVSTCYLITTLIERDLAAPSVGTPANCIVPAFNTVHRLAVAIELELTKTYLCRKILYERRPRNPRLAEMLAKIPRGLEERR